MNTRELDLHVHAPQYAFRGMCMDLERMENSGLVSYVGKVNMDREASEALTEKSADISAYTTFGWINAVKDKFAYTKPIPNP